MGVSVTTTKGEGMAETKVEDFQEWDEVVLQDVFAHTCNRLQGWLIAEEREARAAGDEGRADAWRAEWFALGDERSEVRAADWKGQAAAILRWRQRQDEVDAGGGPRIVAG